MEKATSANLLCWGLQRHDIFPNATFPTLPTFLRNKPTLAQPDLSVESDRVCTIGIASVMLA